MQADDDFNLINIVRHLQYCMKQKAHQGDLMLEYKFAKPQQSVQGNKKFQKIVQKSYEKIMIMNANRQMKQKPYVRLKSLTYPEEFIWFQKNIQTLKIIHKFQSQILQKLDIPSDKQRLTYDSSTNKWQYKHTNAHFRPNYEAVLNGKLFRIALTSLKKRKYQPKIKLLEVLERQINKIIVYQRQQIQRKNDEQYQKDQDEKVNNNISEPNSYVKKPPTQTCLPLRFKKQSAHHIDQYFTITLCSVYQIRDLNLYKQILKLMENKKEHELGKMILSELVKSLFQKEKKNNKNMQVKYQVEMKFDACMTQDFYDMDQELIQKTIEKTAQVFLELAKDPHQFSPDEIVKRLNWLDGK